MYLLSVVHLMGFIIHLAQFEALLQLLVTLVITG